MGRNGRILAVYLIAISCAKGPLQDSDPVPLGSSSTGFPVDPPSGSVGEADARAVIESLQRLARVEETPPLLPFVTPRARSWLVGQRIDGIRNLLSGEVASVECREGRCLARWKTESERERVMVLLERPSGLLWDPIASEKYLPPEPAPPPSGNEADDPDVLSRWIPGTGPLVALLKTNFGTLRCALETEENPLPVISFVGLATGRRNHRDPVTGDWVGTPCFDHQELRLSADSRGFFFFCPGNSEDAGPGFWDEDRPRRSLRMDRPGRLCFDPPSPNRVGGRLFVAFGPDPDRDGLVTVLGQCGPESLIQRLSAGFTQKRSSREESPRLLEVQVVREEKAVP